MTIAPDWDGLRKSVRGYLGARNLKPEHAEDLTQTTLLRLLERVGGGESFHNAEGAAFREADHARYRDQRSRRDERAALGSPVGSVHLPDDRPRRGRPRKDSPRRRQAAVIFRPDGSLELVSSRKGQVAYLTPVLMPKSSLLYVLRAGTEDTELTPWSPGQLRHVVQALDRRGWRQAEAAIQQPRRKR